MIVIIVYQTISFNSLNFFMYVQCTILYIYNIQLYICIINANPLWLVYFDYKTNNHYSLLCYILGCCYPSFILHLNRDNQSETTEIRSRPKYDIKAFNKHASKSFIEWFSYLNLMLVLQGYSQRSTESFKKAGICCCFSHVSM